MKKSNPMLDELKKILPQIAANAVTAEQKRYPTDEELSCWRTNQAYAIKMCCEAVNRLFEVAGGSTWIHDNEIQRLWRDCNMTAAHAYTDYDVCKQVLGRSLMGMDPDPTMV